jgi:hypothetical protein
MVRSRMLRLKEKGSKRIMEKLHNEELHVSSLPDIYREIWPSAIR